MAQVLLVRKHRKEVHGVLQPQDILRLIVGEKEVRPAPVHMQVVEVSHGSTHQEVGHHLQLSGDKAQGTAKWALTWTDKLKSS